MKQKKLSVKAQYILLCLISAVSVFGGIFAQKEDSTVIRAAAIALPVLVCVLLNSKDTLLLIGILLPVNRVLTMGGCSVLILIAFATVLKEFFQKNIVVPKKIMFVSLTFIFYACIVSRGGQLFGAAKIILMLFYFIGVLRHMDTKQLFGQLLFSIVFGIALATVANILIAPSGGSGVSRFRIGESGGNILGIECGVLAVCLLILLLQGIGNNWRLCIEMMTVLLIGLMTASKSFLLALIVGGIWSFLFIMLKPKTRQMWYVWFGIIGLAGGIILLLAMKGTFYSYFAQMLHRIVAPTRGDITNGRIEIWMQYFEVFRSHPQYLWFGNLNYLDFGIEWVAHNMIIEQIAEYGIVGSAILIYLYVRVFKKLDESNKCRYKLLSMNAAPMVAFLTVSMASHTLLGFPQTLLLLICWMCGIQSWGKSESAVAVKYAE